MKCKYLNQLQIWINPNKKQKEKAKHGGTNGKSWLTGKDSVFYKRGQVRAWWNGSHEKQTNKNFLR